MAFMIQNALFVLHVCLLTRYHQQFKFAPTPHVVAASGAAIACFGWRLQGVCDDMAPNKRQRNYLNYLNNNLDRQYDDIELVSSSPTPPAESLLSVATQRAAPGIAASQQPDDASLDLMTIDYGGMMTRHLVCPATIQPAAGCIGLSQRRASATTDSSAASGDACH